MSPAKSEAPGIPSVQRMSGDRNHAVQQDSRIKRSDCSMTPLVTGGAGFTPLPYTAHNECGVETTLCHRARSLAGEVGA